MSENLKEEKMTQKNAEEELENSIINDLSLNDNENETMATTTASASHDDAKRPIFGNRHLTNQTDVFKFNAWFDFIYLFFFLLFYFKTI